MHSPVQRKELTFALKRPRILKRNHEEKQEVRLGYWSTSLGEKGPLQVFTQRKGGGKATARKKSKEKKASHRTAQKRRGSGRKKAVVLHGRMVKAKRKGGPTFSKVRLNRLVKKNCTVLRGARDKTNWATKLLGKEGRQALGSHKKGVKKTSEVTKRKRGGEGSLWLNSRKGRRKDDPKGQGSRKNPFRKKREEGAQQITLSTRKK